MNEKADLLDEIGLVLNPSKRLDLTYFATLVFALVFTFVVLFPKIYIHQQIYYTSRDISKLQGEYDILKEENRIIKASVESIKFKNQILDTIF